MRCGLAGHPAAHSLSPAIHRAAYRELGLDWSYDAFDVPPPDFAAFVRGLTPDWRGLSVTMPHKAEVVQFGRPDQMVQLTGVANTLVLEPDGQRHVHNTDIGGFVLACRSLGVEAIKSAIIIGNGATAASALVAVRELGCRTMCLVVRDLTRAKGILDLAAELKVATSVALLGNDVPAGDLLVSTVPVAAVAPHTEKLVAGARAVFDVVYDPWPTALGTEAVRQGRRTLNGVDLLAAQAVDQVALMTGARVDFSVLRAAAVAELRRRTATTERMQA